ncbi:hypothetical protein J421_0400 [Gemmatirosa kalamazoonensis]|jgi:hypothetical protein|uniref:Lipoprotein n=1 Tax=Gemmatirosa kalamazoonensis TaxID=861299 RepID=W0RBV8_9BACT|nr:hypothetical protein [Gemmatirosa kalamazoonensis]AHG87937.1 hypothetical protein J421_0400 [Gemmatirosa kalamazoonensis]
MITARRLRLRFALSRRRPGRALVLLPLVAMMALVTACSDSPTEAAGTSRPRATSAFDKTGAATDPKTETFVYDGRARTQSFGDGHSVRFDANSVCDPKTSGYGPGTWDQPCTPATQPITFTVTSWRNADGRVQVVFSPDVRFVPGTTEILFLGDAAPGAGKKATIEWCSPLLATGCIDESVDDPTLTTYVTSGKVARRIKHFSGYNVVFGLTDTAGAL